MSSWLPGAMPSWASTSSSVSSDEAIGALTGNRVLPTLDALGGHFDDDFVLGPGYVQRADQFGADARNLVPGGVGVLPGEEEVPHRARLVRVGERRPLALHRLDDVVHRPLVLGRVLVGAVVRVDVEHLLRG